MKMFCTIVGIILIVIAGIYFVTPADTLPSYFPGHEAGVMRVHVKHARSPASPAWCSSARLVVRAALRPAPIAFLETGPCQGS